MKQHVLEKWPGDNSLSALMFFSQSVEEMLYDRTVDHYRYNFFNAHVLCKLLNDEIIYFDVRGRNTVLIRVICEFLKRQLKRDCKLGILASPVFENYIEKLRCAKDNDLAVLLSLSSDLMPVLDKDYLSGVLSEIRNLVSRNSKKLDKLRYLANVFVSELILKGYSQKHIYLETKRLFFPSEGKGVKHYNLNTLNLYLKHFPSVMHRYQIHFFTNLEYDELAKRDLVEFDIQVAKPDPSLYNIRIEAELRKLLQKDSLTGLIVRDVKALDPFSAYNIAKRLVEFIESLEFMRHHTVQRIPILPLAISLDEDGRTFMTGPSTDAISKRPNRTIDLESYTFLSEHLLKPTRLTADSKQRIVHLLINHKNAIETESDESKLIAMWSTLEQLVGIFNSTDDVVETIREYILPILIDNYPKILVNDLLNNLKYFAKVDNHHESTIGNPLGVVRFCAEEED